MKNFTRLWHSPRAIKMCPLVKRTKTRKDMRTVCLCVAGQHRQMLDQVLESISMWYQITTCQSLKERQTFDVTTNILNRIKVVLETEKPDVVLWFTGDTSTTFVTALALFHLQIPVGHVEAGSSYIQRIFTLIRRNLTGRQLTLYRHITLPPTEMSRLNLINEGRGYRNNIYVTGNTAIDAPKKNNGVSGL